MASAIKSEPAAAGNGQQTGAAGGDSDPIADALLTPEALRARTKLERKYLLSAGGSVQVSYRPPADMNYDVNQPNDVPFEVIQFVGTETSSEIHVEGSFPSNAAVLVTDEHFNVLSAALTKAEGTEPAVATVKVPGTGVRLVLVRDVRWVKPMKFDVHVR